MRDPESQARRMVELQLRSRGLRDESVLSAMLTVPRHSFVGAAEIDEAYADRALPTCEGQTISQPYIVAKMTELLAVRPQHRVLEIGTGSGYQAAILAQMGAHVISVESRHSLADHAREVLAKLDLPTKVRVVVADGSLGFEEQAPYDRIIVTAAAPHLPHALRAQLADDGRIVIPLGTRDLQYLTVFERHDNTWTDQRHTACRFVPLVGENGWA